MREIKLDSGKMTKKDKRLIRSLIVGMCDTYGESSRKQWDLLVTMYEIIYCMREITAYMHLDLQQHHKRTINLEV